MKSSDGRFEYLDRVGDPLPDGTLLTNVGQLQYQCRSQKRSHCSVNLGKNAGYQIENHNWHLTGTTDKPTIAPSINCADCWHGFIENGVFVNCSKEPEARQ